MCKNKLSRNFAFIFLRVFFMKNRVDTVCKRCCGHFYACSSFVIHYQLHIWIQQVMQSCTSQVFNFTCLKYSKVPLKSTNIKFIFLWKKKINNKECSASLLFWNSKTKICRQFFSTRCMSVLWKKKSLNTLADDILNAGEIILSREKLFFVMVIWSN